MLILRQTAEHAAPGAQTEQEKKKSLHADKDIIKISRPGRHNKLILTFGNISASFKSFAGDDNLSAGY